MLRNFLDQFVFDDLVTAISHNQPLLSTSALWNDRAITFANSSTAGNFPNGLFVDTNNTVYVAERSNNRIRVWLEGATTPTRNISGNSSSPFSVFVASNGDIYMDNGQLYGRVDKRVPNGTTNSWVMYVEQACYGLFIDVSNNLYCSMRWSHRVAMKSLNDNSSMWITAAGTGCAGSSSYHLNFPLGIFVDADLNLFVADCGNDRIQKFLSKQLDATTVAGNGAAGTPTLNCPSGVILDGNGYLYIADTLNNRIVASRSDGFRCIFGCSIGSGSLSNQLSNPTDLKFDTYGNIFVVDQNNSRIQKIMLLSNATYRKCSSQLIEETKRSAMP